MSASIAIDFTIFRIYMSQREGKMEEETKPLPKSRYECDTCGAIHELPRDMLENMKVKDPMKCTCKKGHLKLLNSEYYPEEIELARIELGKAYEAMIAFMDDWIDMPEDYKKLVAIWLIGTYFHKSFNTYPYLFFNASKGSGKTRILRIISYLQHNGNGNLLNNPSESVLFRTAKERGLIFDEFESEMSKEKQTMREYLNSCYKKGGVVYRMEKQRTPEGKEEYVAVPHELYTPIAMANIKGIEDVLADRSITLILEKSMKMEIVKKIEMFESDLALHQIKRTLLRNSCIVCSVYGIPETIARWNLFATLYTPPTHTTHTTHTTQDLIPPCNNEEKKSLFSTIREEEMFHKIYETGIYGRNLEIFFPLLIVSSMISTECLDDLLKIIKQIDENKIEDQFTESMDASLIDFISQKERYRFDPVLISELLREFKEYVGYQSEEENRSMNPSWLGTSLKRLGLIGRKKRINKGVMAYLNVDKAKIKLNMYKKDDKKE